MDYIRKTVTIKVCDELISCFDTKIYFFLNYTYLTRELNITIYILLDVFVAQTFRAHVKPLITLIRLIHYKEEIWRSNILSDYLVYRHRTIGYYLDDQ